MAKRTILGCILTLIMMLFITSVEAKIHPDMKNKRKQRLYKTSARPDLEFKAHNIGTMWNVVTNYGSFGDPNFDTTGRPSAEWPGGTRNSFLYDAAIWVSTLVNGEKLCSSYFYSFEEWEPSEGTQFLMGNEEVASVINPVSIHDSYCVFDDLESKADHTALGIRVIEHGLSWSMPEYDDFLIYEFQVINTGLNGFLREVYIGWWYDVDVASIDVSDKHIDDLVDYDGWDGTDTKTDEIDLVDPLDLDGDGETGYDDYGIPYGSQMGGFNPEYDETLVEGDGVYDEYSLIEDERGVAIMADVAVTIGDYEISAGDTLRRADGTPVIGWKFPRGMSYIYDADNPSSSENDFGERNLKPDCAGFMAGRVLYSDPTSVDYYYENPDSLRSRICRPFSHQWWNWESDPGNNIEQYDYMKGQHEFSKGYKFLPNPLDLNAPTFDYRFLTTIGPYDLAPDDTIKVVWAELVGQGLQGMRENSDNAIKAYYAGSVKSSPLNPSAPNGDVHYLLPAPPATPNLRYSPDDRSVTLVWDDISEITPDTKTKEIDFVGYKIYRAKYSPSNWTMIAAFDNIPNTVVNVLNTERDSIGTADLPDITHEFVDVGGVTPWGTSVESPINGIPYYYAVVAYDSGDPEIGLPPSESGKTNYSKTESGAPVAVIPKAMYETEVTNFDMSNIKVVPNPYKATDVFEDIYESAILFTNLPPVAKITIFTLTGDHIVTLDHTDGSSIEKWDLISRNTQSIVSGLYVYVVETDDDKFIGKFVVIMGS